MMLLGVITPDAGWFEIAGHRLPESRTPALANVGFSAGYMPLAERLRVREFLLSGVFYPVESLPALIRPIARVLPTTHAFAAMRVILDEGHIPWGTIGLGSLGAAVLTALALGFLLRMLKLFRARGFITRYS
jgi:hypothetical protein